MRGSVRQKGEGRWQVRVSLGRDPVSGRYRTIAREVRGRKRDAELVAAKLVAEVERGAYRDQEVSRHSVADLLEDWLAHIEAQGRAASTLTRYRSVISVNIVPRLGDVQITKLGPAQIDSYYSQLRKAGLGTLSIRKNHTILSAAFNQAVRWGWVERNPVDRASPPSARPREIRPPTLDQLRQLVQACLDDREDLGSLIYVAAATGARRGELCGLRWGDLDLDAASMTINRSISDAGPIVAVKGTKTHQARRLALDPSTVAVLVEQRRRAEGRADAAGARLSVDAYVWSQAVDAAIPYRPDRVTGAFRTLRDRLGMHEVTFHGLRHFAATTLASQGVGVRTIAGRLGHANPAVTLRTYAHFLDTADREAAVAIGAVLAGLHPASSKRSSTSSSARRGTTSLRPSRTDGISRRATRS